MKEAFKAGGDFHSRTAMNMYPHVREAVEKERVLLEWEGQGKPPAPLLKVQFWLNLELLNLKRAGRCIILTHLAFSVRGKSTRGAMILTCVPHRQG